MIIDCHVHLNNYYENSVETLPACLEKLELEMRRNRIDQALVLTSYTISPGRPGTRRVVEAVRDKPYLTVIAGLDYTKFQADDLHEIAEFVAAGKVRGLKLYPGYQPFYPLDPKWTPAYEFAALHKIPVMIHTGDTYSPKGKLKYSHPLHVDEVAVEFPEVNFLICHLGNPWIRDCMEVVYKNANVYTDMSGLTLGEFEDRFEVFLRKQVSEMLSYGVEPDALLYGTDWPISSMASYLDFMKELAIPQKERSLVMAQNAIELYGLDPANSLIGSVPRR